MPESSGKFQWAAVRGTAVKCCVVQDALRCTYAESEPVSHQGPDSEDRWPYSHHVEARSPDP